MKQCPKCYASIIDTAKFCSKCGVNIKKYEEENAKDRFCPECGTAIADGDFCTECGFKIGAVTTDTGFGSTDSFGDDWLGDIESSTDAAVAKTRENDAQWQIKQAFAAFEYEEHTDGTYTVTGLKDKTALQYTVPNNAVAISDNAFEGCNAIKITLPDTLLQIGSCAFKGCQNLSNINLPDSLMIVGDEAFSQCEMLDIELPASIRKIGKDAIKNTVQDKKRAAEEEARRAELAKWEVGGTTTFGSYYKDSSGSKSPIEWLVLERNGSRALLISKYLLDCKQYNTENVSTTWETSSLRKWLNNGFLKEAFSDSEQQKIPCTKVSTPNNTTYNTNGGNTTTDKIFVLSIDEANRYFASGDKRMCSPTAYAVSNGAYKNDNGCGWWWLRSPGLHQNYAADVDNDGGVHGSGGSVNSSNVGVRPALWINLES